MKAIEEGEDLQEVMKRVNHRRERRIADGKSYYSDDEEEDQEPEESQNPLDKDEYVSEGSKGGFKAPKNRPGNPMVRQPLPPQQQMAPLSSDLLSKRATPTSPMAPMDTPQASTGLIAQAMNAEAQG